MKRNYASLIWTILILSCFPANAQYKNGHAYVDLGLPSGNLWATCNMGASDPTDYGDYYAWGELSPKRRYDWDTYKFYDSSRGLTKYNHIDQLNDLEPEDDVAHIRWGGNWQIPTAEDWYELIENVDIYTVHENGEVYYSLESKHNSGKLIIPLNRFKSHTGERMVKDGFCIWLACRAYFIDAFPAAAEPGKAFSAFSALNDDHDFPDIPIEISRCNGAAIRPVYCKTPKQSKK